MASIPNSAVVLLPNGAPLLSIELKATSADGTVVLQKSMAREAKEPVVKTLERMRMLLGDDKRQKGKKLTREEILTSLPPAAILDISGAEMDVQQSNKNVWSAAATLVLGPHSLRVLFNIPTVTQMTPPAVLVAGLPTMCTGISVMFCSESDLLFEWIVGEETVCTTRVYTPAVQHIGQQVRCRCRADMDGSLWTEVTAPTAVVLAPSDTIMPRWAHTGKRACEAMQDADAFRVVSYNILHDRYCTSNFAKTKLYPFASEDILSLNYRRGAIARELSAYRGDIVLLQECGQSLFESFLVHTFRSDGMEAQYTNKCGQAKEGNVIAFAADRFEAVSSYALSLNAETLSSQHTAIATEVEGHPHLYHALQQMTAVAAVVVLKDRKDESRRVIVANTHLFYHADGCHIRALQMYMLAQSIAATAQQLQTNGIRVHVVLGGDFNFTPTTGAYELVTKGAVSDTRDCWDKGFKFWWGCGSKLGASEEGQEEGAAPAAAGLSEPPQEVFRASLALPMTFEDSLAGEASRRWTNYAMNFKEVIDFIFTSRFNSDERIRTARTIPLPSEVELSRNVAIPNAMFPSDHIAQVVDLTFAKPAAS